MEGVNPNNYVDLFEDSSDDDVKMPARPKKVQASTNVGSNVVFFIAFGGPPIAKKRPKSAPVRGGGGDPGRFYKPRTYDAQKKETAKLKADALEQLEEQGVTEYPIYKEDELVVVEMEFYRKIPNELFQGNNRERPLRPPNSLSQNFGDNKTPDIDNLAKMYLDAMQEIVYQDDKQVAKLICYKLMDVRPPHIGHTTFYVRRLQSKDLPRPMFTPTNDSTCRNRAIRLWEEEGVTFNNNI